MSGKPSHKCFVVEDKEEGSDEKAFWTRVGSAWPHGDGKGLNVQIASGVAVSGRLVLREYTERTRRGRQEGRRARGRCGGNTPSPALRAGGSTSMRDKSSRQRVDTLCRDVSWTEFRRDYVRAFSVGRRLATPRCRGQIAVLSGVEKFVGGWRARCARPVLYRIERST